MKSLHYIALFFTSLFFVQIGIAQSTFKNTFTSSGGFRDACPTADGGFVGCGFTNVVHVIKMDEDGKIVWSLSLEDEQSFFPTKIVATGENDDIFIMGMLVQNGTGSILLAKIDKDGNYIESKQFYHSATNLAWDMIADGRGGVMMVGGGCNGNNFVIRSDNHLNLEWQKGYGFQSTATATAITLLNNGNFVVAGYSYNGSDNRPYCIYSIDPQGTLLWSKVIFGFGETRVLKILELSNGDLALLSVSKPLPLPTADDAIIMRLNAEAELVWTRRISTTGWEALNDMVELQDGSIMFVGYNSYGTGNDAMIGTISGEGEVGFLLNIPAQANNNLTAESITSIAPICEDKFAVFGFLDGIGMAFINDKGEGFCESELIPQTVFSVTTPEQPPVPGNLVENTLNFDVQDFNLTASDALLTDHIYCDFVDPEATECLSTNVSDVINNPNIEIHPNPVNHRLSISSDVQIDRIEVFSNEGAAKQVNHSNLKLLDVSSFSPGIYYIKIHTATESTIHRFIKI